MRLKDLDKEFRQIFNFSLCDRADPGLNGLQVGREDKDINKIAFCVDASLSAIERAAHWGADLLLVHHGLFWYSPAALTGALYRRIKALVENDLPLYALHLPMDYHKELGHAAGWTKTLGLTDVQDAFGYKGILLGLKGILPESLTIDATIEKLGFRREDCLAVWPFGKKNISTVGILPGGGIKEYGTALKEELDLFITGDISHEQYFPCLEEGLNVLALGHYQSEIPGLKSLMQVCEEKWNMQTLFIDMPTRL